MIVIDGIKNLNLKDSITCGQIFRFKEESDDSYTVILSDRVINIKQDKNKLIVESDNYNNLEEIVVKYLDLDTDYDSINKNLLNIDDNLKEIIEKSKGLKMIRQEPFETVIEYIISANNRVPSITNSMNILSEKYGKKVIFKNKEYYLFPRPEDLKDLTAEDFRQAKVGFRDKYLYNIVKSINDKKLDLNSLYDLETDNAFKLLTSYLGIGTKVASCILLFAYGRFDVFPIDTWVKKYMMDLYGINNEKIILKTTKEKYGKYSGLVIQYMFHSKRNK